MACWHTSVSELSNGKLYIKSGNRSNSYYGKFWVAKIVGHDPKFTFSREFVNDSDGAVIEKDGIYQIFRTCQWAKRPENYFIEVVGNEYITLSKEQVIGKI